MRQHQLIDLPINPPRLCPVCQTTLSRNAPQGLCPRCLIQLGAEPANGPSKSPAEPETQQVLSGDDASLSAPADFLCPVAAHLVKDFGDYEFLEEIARG